MILQINADEKNALVAAIGYLEKIHELEFGHSHLTKKDIQNLVKVQKRAEKLHKIKPRSAKNKGLEYQKKICEFISELIGIEYNQTDDNSLIHSRESGVNGTDVILRGEAAEKFKYSVECKNCNNINLPEWIEQAKSNEKEDRPYLLFIKSKRLNNDIICMDLKTFRKFFIKCCKKL